MKNKNQERIISALKELSAYKNLKSAFDNRVDRDEKFIEKCHTPPIDSATDLPQSASARLFSAIVNKHADIMQSYPAPDCLPREASDSRTAAVLNVIIPTVLERNSFANTFSEVQYDKLKHGIGIYGIFWNICAENGLGDIDIKRIDPKSLYWDMSAENIQDSESVFCVTFESKEKLKSMYKNYSENAHGVHADGSLFALLSSTAPDKVPVIDRYYKKHKDGKSVLHFMKFTPNCLLYDSQYDEKLKNGFYSHGMYPFITDIQYKDRNNLPYGYISLNRSTQEYIDRLDTGILQSVIMSSRPRFMMKKNVGIRKDDFLDWQNPIIEVEGDLSNERVKQLTVENLPSSVLNVRQAKIDEMKEVSANRDFNTGGAIASITSGAAISALQDAGNKVSHDIISGTWLSFSKLCLLLIELIREFYTEERVFRITNPNGRHSYVSFSNSQISEQEIKHGSMITYRRPIFDISVHTASSTKFDDTSKNEMIIELCKLGLFKPENKTEALTVLNALNFDGKYGLIETIKGGDAV